MCCFCVENKGGTANDFFGNQVFVCWAKGFGVLRRNEQNVILVASKRLTRNVTNDKIGMFRGAFATGIVFKAGCASSKTNLHQNIGTLADCTKNIGIFFKLEFG